MSVFTYICTGLSAGVVLCFAAGGLKALFHHRPYSSRRVDAVHRLVGKVAALLKYITFMLLALGLVWCAYFLVLGISCPEQADYANSMAELIVAVLMVISILFAFVKFLRRKGSSKLNLSSNCATLIGRCKRTATCSQALPFWSRLRTRCSIWHACRPGKGSDTSSSPYPEGT